MRCMPIASAFFGGSNSKSALLRPTKNWMWGMVDSPVERYLGPAGKSNINLPQVLLAHEYLWTKKHVGLSRA